LLGNHEDDAPLSEALQQALDRARKEMNGGGIWRNPGPGANPYELLVTPKHAAIAEWQARTLQVLRKHLEPAPGANALELGVVVDIDPVQLSLSATRRAFVDIAGVVDSDLGRRPLLLVAEAAWRVWGPLSLWARWYRLPRFRDGTLAIDDDVLVGVSVNGALTPR
jgi:hypothetical protein